MRRRYWPLLVAIPSVMIVGGMANGYWSAPGGGSGAAGTSLPASVALSAGQPSGDLFPGDTSAVAVTATNPNTYPVLIGTLELDPTAGVGGYDVDAAHAGCPPAVLTYATQTNGGSGWTVPAASDGAAGELSIDLPDALGMAVDATDACRGANFEVHLVSTP